MEHTYNARDWPDFTATWQPERDHMAKLQAIAEAHNWSVSHTLFWLMNAMVNADSSCLETKPLAEQEWRLNIGQIIKRMGEVADISRTAYTHGAEDEGL